MPLKKNDGVDYRNTTAPRDGEVFHWYANDEDRPEVSSQHETPDQHLVRLRGELKLEEQRVETLNNRPAERGFYADLTPEGYYWANRPRSTAKQYPSNIPGDDHWANPR